MTGLIPGATVHNRAIRIAGILAELGITRLTLHSPGAAPQSLSARATDLPAQIAGAPDGSALDSSIARLTIHPDRVCWESVDEEFIRAARAISQDP